MVEFPTSDACASARFFKAAFGWRSTAYGPHYRDVATGPVAGDGPEMSLGFQQDPVERPGAPLVVIGVDDLEATRSRVEAAGGLVSVEPFGFPGGRRFHFREPGGNELAAWVPDHGSTGP